MSALALILLARGFTVRGSDRGYDKGDTPEKFKALELAGIKLFPQDGSGITKNIDKLIVSSAIEESVPDVRQALLLKVPIEKRAEILAGLVNKMHGICVGGTSGKTTVTGMIAHMLQELDFAPSVMNGGQIISFLEQGLPGNALAGHGDLFVTEIDESDGSIALFEPAIAVVNNITLDHKPLAELRPLFRDFIRRARDAVIINLDDPEAALLAELHPHTLTFAIDNPAATVSANGIDLKLKVPGRHNLSNALAALTVAKALGIPLERAKKALESFKGIKRRFEVIGSTSHHITVIDDFGHNPEKIEATLRTLKQDQGRVIIVFQPHGFGPTRMLKEGFVKTFARYLSETDILLMPEIYFAGGTADKTISSRDIIKDIAATGKIALFMDSRAAIKSFIKDNAISGDRIVIMGARDDTLPDFACSILISLEEIETGSI